MGFFIMAERSSQSQCEAQTKSGQKCKKMVLYKYCVQHQKQLLTKAKGIEKSNSEKSLKRLSSSNSRENILQLNNNNNNNDNDNDESNSDIDNNNNNNNNSIDNNKLESQQLQSNSQSQIQKKKTDLRSSISLGILDSIFELHSDEKKKKSLSNSYSCGDIFNMNTKTKLINLTPPPTPPPPPPASPTSNRTIQRNNSSTRKNRISFGGSKPSRNGNKRISQSYSCNTLNRLSLGSASIIQNTQISNSNGYSKVQLKQSNSFKVLHNRLSLGNSPTNF
eukprot:Pgem_evm1s5462